LRDQFTLAAVCGLRVRLVIAIRTVAAVAAAAAVTLMLLSLLLMCALNKTSQCTLYQCDRFLRKHRRSWYRKWLSGCHRSQTGLVHCRGSQARLTFDVRR